MIITGIALLAGGNAISRQEYSVESAAETTVPEVMRPAYSSGDVTPHTGGFEHWFNSTVGGGLVPAASAGVVSADGLIYSHTKNASIDTRFDIASLSKTFTAIMVLALQERGTLSLHDPVRQHLPELIIEQEERGSEPVKIIHLLSHTSGIPSYSSQHQIVRLKNTTISFPKQRHPAGTCYAYSNESFVILKHVIEAATGKQYGEVLREIILDPLGMDSSHGNHSNGTGGVVTTLRDLSKYTAMLIREGGYENGRIISRKSFQRLLSPVLEHPQVRVDYHYSLSWEVITINGKVDSFYKAGRWGGAASAIQVFPQKGIAMIYLSNPPHHLSKGFMEWRQSLTGRLRGILRGTTNDANLCRSWPYLTPEELQPYQGTYVHSNGHRVKVYMSRGKLYSTYFGAAQPLQVFTSLRFLSPVRGGLHSFVWEDDRVVGLALRNGYYRLQQEQDH